jgi:serine/threonine-protein kinase
VDSRVGTAFGKYSISRGCSARAEWARLYEAYDNDKGRTVALKILSDAYSRDNSFRTRFQRESRAAAILQEPHVIPIHDWGEIDGHLYIDMRLVQGQTLDACSQRDRWSRRGRSTSSARWVPHSTLHTPPGSSIGTSSRRTSSVTPTDFAYLVDFGIAEATGDTRLTAGGMKIGTLNYMAPERFTEPVATSAVDVYALACVLYEALTGEAPYSGDNLQHLLAAHVTLPPPRPSETNPRSPAALDDVVARGMAKDPDDRYGTAGGLGRAAARALTSGQPTAVGAAPTIATPTTPNPPARQPDPRPGRGSGCCRRSSPSRPRLSSAVSASSSAYSPE